MKKRLMLSGVLFISALSCYAKNTQNHPCTQFAKGDASYASRLIADVVAAVAGASAKNQEDLLLAAFFPLFHHIAHTETDSLNDHAVLKWLASNWTTLGLCGVVGYLYKNDPALWRKIMFAIYGQHALAIVAAQLDLDDVIDEATEEKEEFTEEVNVVAPLTEELD